jgi:hypothetical protein
MNRPPSPSRIPVLTVELAGHAACIVEPGGNMAKETTERSDELTDPNNPPRSVLKPEARRAAVWSYLGPVIALFVIVGVALIYWANRGPSPRDARTDDAAIGTVGRDSPGGFNPQPTFNSTEEEVRFRGDAPGPEDNSIRSIEDALQSDASSPRRVTLEDVTVENVQGSVTWVKDGDQRIAVATESTPAVKAGDTALVSGMTERDSQGRMRIRGSIAKK